MLSYSFFGEDLLVLDVLLRVVLALILGFAIGFERKMRFKEAGVRTHTIVCIGSCLYMVISMFAFVGADMSRVAAQIVTGIGFLGAGMIFYHKEMVHGLTTAAGIWATAAIGMAAGAGWYIVSIVATVLIILLQCIMHTNFKVFHSHHFVKVNVVFEETDGEQSEKVRALFEAKRFSKVNTKRDGDRLLTSVVISTDKIINARQIYKFLNENPNIISIARQDDDF